MRKNLRRTSQMHIKIELDAETAERLARMAVKERRPIPLQAEVLLRRALIKVSRNAGGQRRGGRTKELAGSRQQ